MTIERGRPAGAGRTVRGRERPLPWPQLAELVPYSRQHVGRLEANGRFPKRLQIGPGRVAWRESEILGWLEERRRGALRPWNPTAPRHGQPEAG
jgi:prophage regulatory protein